ncbi:MAG TPA: hypothetical protein VK747_18535, partial [Blastocatellia bacterium]|nr:hypothetical protein [Blastocatellia bacterium]
MKSRKTLHVIVAVLLVLSTGSQALSDTSCYPNAPIVLACNVEMAVGSVVKNNDPDRINDNLATLMFYTIADAVAGVDIALP